MLAIGEDVRTIITLASGREYPNCYDGSAGGPLVICNGGGDRGSMPELTDKRIAFNGMDPDLSHETFMIDAVRELPYDGADADRLGWRFCKTAHKPYDVVVTAVLTYLVAQWDFEASSDGGIEDWDAGVKLVEEALGREFANPLIVEHITS